MRRILLYLTLSLTALSGAYLWLSTPQRAEDKITQAFAQAGFENVQFSAPKAKIGALTYHDIKLDQDGFSTIGTLELRYNPFTLLLTGRPDALIFKDLDLTGELHSDGRIALAGWKSAPPAALPEPPPLLQFENARLSLLSDKWGGIALESDLQLRSTKDGLIVEGRIDARQRQLSLEAKIEGRVTPEGFWEGRAELEQGKFEMGELRATRLAGLLLANGQDFYNARIVGELRAGGLSIFGLPWQDGAITLDGSPVKPRLILAAKSIGFEGIELGLTIPDLYRPGVFGGQFHIARFETALDYLESQDRLPAPRQDLSPLETLENIEILFLNREGLRIKAKNNDDPALQNFLEQMSKHTSP